MPIQAITETAKPKTQTLWLIKNPQYHTQGDMTLTEEGIIRKDAA